MKTIDIEKLKELVPLAKSWSHLCKLIDHQNRHTLKILCENNNFITSHFSSKTSRIKSPKISIEVYLNNEKFLSSATLRNRLIEENLKSPKCEICNYEKWNNLSIPLQLHHIDGNPSNNNLKNLQIICPNCHAQTPNYCGKNSDKVKKLCKKHLKKEEYISAINSSYTISQVISKLELFPNNQNRIFIKRFMYDNQLEFAKKPISIKIRKPRIKKEKKQKILKTKEEIGIIHRKIKERPSKEELLKTIWEIPMIKIAEKYNLSDNAIRKWAKNYNIPFPSRGYWTKLKYGKIQECNDIKNKYLMERQTEVESATF